MKIIRVFPRRTAATPDDNLAIVNSRPVSSDAADEVHISVVFTWDIPRAEKLANEWKVVAPVKMGGPALGERGEDFVPGRYLKNGYVITSRGCPNRCWFCSVWRREGDVVRELPVQPGWNVLDDNLLACSRAHIREVFNMLALYKQRHGVRVEFTGGLEAARLQRWHVKGLARLKPGQIFFAYDTPDDLDPLQEAGKLLYAHGFKIKNPLRAYVLCGWKGDSFEAAEKRMWEAVDAGFLPMAMLYRDKQGFRKKEWAQWQRGWARPAAIHAKMKERF